MWTPWIQFWDTESAASICLKNYMQMDMIFAGSDCALPKMNGKFQSVFLSGRHEALWTIQENICEQS